MGLAAPRTRTDRDWVVLPSIDFKAVPNTNYQRATISILHRIDLDDMQQQAQVSLNLVNSARLVQRTIYDLSGHTVG